MRHFTFLFCTHHLHFTRLVDLFIPVVEFSLSNYLSLSLIFSLIFRTALLDINTCAPHIARMA